MPIVANQGDSDYSPTWKWADSEVLEGGHVEFRKASTDNGDVVVWEIDSDGHGPVSVWVEPMNLKAKVQRELRNRRRERGAGQLEDGERVRIDPGVKRPSKRNPSQSVWPFPVVEFEHGVPDRSAEELLLDGAEAEPDDDELDEAASGDGDDEPAAAGASAADDDIPF
jgi:hypothetical protein